MIGSNEAAVPPDQVGALKRATGLDLALLGFALLVAVGSLGPWVDALYISPTTFQSAPVSYPGTSRQGGGYGWITLILAIWIATGIVAGIIKRSSGTHHVIAATLFGCTALVTTVAVLELSTWYVNSYLPDASIGWGLWLCLGSAAAAFFLSTYRCVRHYKR